MTASVRSEFVKLRSTRTVYLLLIGIVGISIVTAFDPNHTAATFREPFNEQGFLFFTSMLTRLLILVLGIRIITDEFRHGTIVPTLLVTPRRGSVLVAKAITATLIGTGAAALAWFAMTGAAIFVAQAEGATLALDATAWATLGGMVVAGAAWGAIGVFLGAVVRNQLAATIGGLIWLMGLEDMARSLLGDLGGYLPGQAGLVMIVGNEIELALMGAATIAVYGGVLALIGARVMRRDIA